MDSLIAVVQQCATTIGEVGQTPVTTAVLTVVLSVLALVRVIIKRRRP